MQPIRVSAISFRISSRIYSLSSLDFKFAPSHRFRLQGDWGGVGMGQGAGAFGSVCVSDGNV